MPETNGGALVVQNARLELLRLLALLDDTGREQQAAAAAEGRPCYWPSHTPLFEGEWQNAREDIILAAREAAALGHVEWHALHASADPTDKLIANLRGGREWMIRITPAGYAWIRAHDMLGEIAQESRPTPPEAARE